MTAETTALPGGAWEVTAGEHPFELSATIMPVGTVMLNERTRLLLGGMAAWSPDYIDTLMELLETVRRIVRSMERDRNQMQAGVRSV